MAQQGQCRLCFPDGIELRRSHILPEFLYDDVYDEKHRTIHVDPRPDKKDQILQKGLREYLLCGKCEGQLAGLERYAAELLRELPSMGWYRPGDIVWKRGIDYKHFKLFQLSLLWRSSIADSPAFGDVDLGCHEERVRRMLVEGNPGRPWEYGCIIAMLRKPGSIQDMVKFPGRHRIEGHRVYHLIMRGLVWFFVVSGHTKRFSGLGSFLSESGDLPIHVVSKTAEDFLAGMARKLTKAGKKL